MKLKRAEIAIFTLPVSIPVPGDEKQAVDVRFKWLGLKAFAENAEKVRIEEITPFEFAQSFIDGWGFEEEFSEENFILLLDLYPMAFSEMRKTYEDEIWNLREKN